MIKPLLWKILILVLNFRPGSAVRYRINASEYEKIPPVFYLEPYEKCMEYPDAVYCVTEIVLVSDTPNQLLDTIREYSAHTSTHYNHTLQRYGICLNDCKHTQGTKGDRRNTIEACLNETYSRKYGLKTKLQKYVRCHDNQTYINVETADIIFLVVLIMILLINFIGSICDFCVTTKNKGLGMRCLTVFSIRQNWRILMSPGAEGVEPRLNKLKGIAGVKAMTTILVITSHSLISAVYYVDNPKVFEEFYRYGAIHMLLNGSVVVQTFFIITGFLLVYNTLLYFESHQVAWSVLPKGILLRWIRLTPAYAFLMFFTVTWMRIVGSGTAWDIAVLDEVKDCRTYWWQHLLYINNYNDVSQCFLHTWYLAADMQLYILGLVVLIACRSWKSRKVVVSLLLLLGIGIPALLTYLKDLDGVVITSPETIIRYFIHNPNFNHLYKRTHSNIFPFAIGLTIGYLVYHLQNINFDIQKYKKYRCIFWFLIPLAGVVVWSGTIFYQDGPRPPMLVRVVYAAFMKPAFNFIVFLEVLSIVFKYEKMVNFVVESQVWTVLSRLSYSAFLIHLTLLRIILGMRTTEAHSSVLFMSQQGVYLVIVSFTAALPCLLLVEQPINQLAKVLLR